MTSRCANPRTGQGGIVLVEAATGLGKSRLLAEAAALAAGRGARVLSASGRDLERDLPFGVALQLFEKPVSRFDDAERERYFSGSAGLAAPLVLEGTPVPEGLSASLHGLYWLSANFAEERPLVLSIDDVHWCDPPTLRFLVYLAQRIQELPITAVLAVAAGHPPEPDPLLDELRAHPATSLVRLEPLSEEAVARGLRESVLPDAEPLFARACHEATRGNPLLLAELAVELAMRDVEPLDGNADIVRSSHRSRSRPPCSSGCGGWGRGHPSSPARSRSWATAPSSATRRRWPTCRSSAPSSSPTR